jgi:hypothetical protein
MAASAAATVTADDLTRRIGVTNDAALQYVGQPDPALDRLPRKAREELITEVPPVTAGALLGTAALARHFVASAATGRYRDLFGLWELFSRDPATCRPVLQERPEALDRARAKLRTATVLGLGGHAVRVAEDVTAARGLIWQWLNEILDEHLPLVARRPAVASALLLREPSTPLHLPAVPDADWLREAADARAAGPLAPAIEELLLANAHRLPATIANLDLLQTHVPDALPGVLGDVDLERDDIGAVLAWARDRGAAAPLLDKIGRAVDAEVVADPVEGLAAWWRWRTRHVELPLPEALLSTAVDAFDLSRPETAELLAELDRRGQAPDVQRALDELATSNRQLAEKAYEAMVCAGLQVALPTALEANPMVRDGARCPACRAWTWVRPGHEQRCPRLTTDGATADGTATDAIAPATDVPADVDGSAAPGRQVTSTSAAAE